MQIVWLKRDLRLQDHEPLRQAFARNVPVLPLYVHEPALIAAVDSAAQHGAFVRETLDEFHRELNALGGSLLEQVGDAVEVLAKLHEATGFTHLWAYQETSSLAGFARDKAVGAWCRSQGVSFAELPQNGVGRGSVYRQQGFKFKEHLDESCTADFFKPAPGLPWAALPVESGQATDIPLSAGTDKPGRLRGGRTAAMKSLAAFVNVERLSAYPGAISSPLTAQRGCSRLSPYLAYGVLSDREVFQRLNNFVSQDCVGLPEYVAKRMRDNVQFYADRMYWRSAYLQSMERRPSSELVSDVESLQHIRDADHDPSWLEAWATGHTGMPLIDASMRMLAETGWLNMRMRGMVTSFAVNELWLPWRDVGLHLAREFLDYEPGIHWNQIQIHAGASRLSGPLTYNAVKQAQDHDPRGVFVRKWVPELRAVPLEHIFEPWKMPPAAQADARCQLGADYPAPLVQHLAASAAARSRVFALREGRVPPAKTDRKERRTQQVAPAQQVLF